MALPLPSAVVVDGVIQQVVRFPVDWTGPDGVTHPAAAWPNWSTSDWDDACPGWLLLPLIDTPPSTPGKIAIQKPQAAWLIDADDVTVTYDEIDRPKSEGTAQCEAAVEAHVDAVARSFGYRSIESAISYATDDTNPQWQIEGISLRKFRGECWRAAYAYIAATASPFPEACLAQLPTLASIAGTANYRAMILRRADAIEATDPVEAARLRQSVS